MLLSTISKYTFKIFIVCTLSIFCLGLYLGNFIFLSLTPSLVELWRLVAIVTLLIHLIFTRGWPLIISHAIVIYTTLISIMGKTIILDLLDIPFNIWLLLGILSFLFMLIVVHNETLYKKSITL